MYPYNYQKSILPGGGYHCVSDILVLIECVDFMEVRHQYFDVPDLKTLFMDVDPSQIRSLLTFYLPYLFTSDLQMRTQNDD